MKLYDTRQTPLDLLNRENIVKSQEGITDAFWPEEVHPGAPRHTGLPLIHATIWSRLESILRDGKLLSHRKLSERWDSFLEDTTYINTDELDQILWLDQFVFLSHGRLAPRLLELSDDLIVFAFKPEYIDNLPGTLYSLKEICEYWSTVSQEWWLAETIFGWMTENEVLESNMQATELFYQSLMLPEFFREFFSQFSTRYQLGILNYLSMLTFPWEEEERTGPFLHNYWQGFQSMAQDEVPLNGISWILCTKKETRRKILGSLPSVPVYTTEYLMREIGKHTWGGSLPINERTLGLLSYLVHIWATDLEKMKELL